MHKSKGRQTDAFVIKPGKALGDLTLGTKISEVFQYVRQSDRFRQVELKYNEPDPLSMSYVLDVKTHGIELRFDAKSQRLELIKIYDLSKLALLYSTRPVDDPPSFSTPDSTPTLQLVYDRFGLTFPGKYIPSKASYVLEYPGIAFAFPVDKNAEPAKPEDMPRTDIKLKTIYLWKTDDKTAYSEFMVVVNIGEGITLVQPSVPTNLASSDPSQNNASKKTSVMLSAMKDISLDFNASTQDVILALGDPDEIFYKNDDPLTLHKQEASFVLDYFYNYFRYGIDILFDGSKHTVKKFILWTNMPNQPFFTRYEKCHYRIGRPAYLTSHATGGDVELHPWNGKAAPAAAQAYPADGDKDDDLLIELGEEPKPGSLANSSSSLRRDLSDDDLSGGSGIGELDREPEVTPDMTFEQISKIFGPPFAPFLHPSAQDSPFGGKHHWYAYKDIIFEVMDNNYVCKVILFKSA